MGQRWNVVCAKGGMLHAYMHAAAEATAERSQPHTVRPLYIDR